MSINLKVDWKKRIYPFLGAVIVFILCFSVLYGGDNVGLSDNGDFRRVLLVNNLEYRDETDSAYLFKQDYKMLIEGDTFGEKFFNLWKNNTEEEIYTSPQFLIIKITKVMNYFANIINGRSENVYSIAYLAFLYILMLSVAAWGIFTFFAEHRLTVRIAVFVLFILIFCDAGYILYFNSFYGEPLQYVALMMLISAGLLIYKRPSMPKVVCFFVSLYFFAGAKLANIPYSIMVCILALTMLVLRSNKRFRTGVLVSCLVAVCAIIQLYASIPVWMQHDTTYQSVFFGILKGSENPERDLKFLGVDEKYAALANTNAYMDDDEYPIDIGTKEFEKEFYKKVPKIKIVLFYIFHPVRLVKNLSVAISNSAYIRPPNVGNSASALMEITNRYSLWSNVRAAIKFPYNPIIVFAGFILITAYTVIIDIFYYKRRTQEPRRNIYMMACFNVLVLGLWVNLTVPVIGNGEADIAKHMFLFANCIDILIAVCILGLFNMRLNRAAYIMLVTSAVIFACSFTASKPSVKFGHYNDKALKWEIHEKLPDGTMILVTKKPVAYLPFDRADNSWEGSDLRSWLNNDFLADFTAEERAKICPVTNAALVSAERKQDAAEGNHTHYWNFTKDGAADLADTAYKYYLEDYVYIPTLDMITDISNKEDYWVMCPYGNNTTMERFVNDDGFVLHTSVNGEKGVRAVVKYKETTGE